MSILILKIIALISMVIDHYGAIFQSGVDIYRIIGRLAFPIYAFLLVEGYTHTSNIKKYGRRLLIFALVSELPFDLAFYGKLSFTHQNIFFTLFIGLVLMYLLDNNSGKYGINKSLLIIIAGLIALVTAVDYNFIGIIYILIFYYTKDYPNPKKILYQGSALFVTNFFLSGFTQQYSILAIPLIYFYNGKLGPNNKILQILFYIAYPLHLIIFYIMK